MHSTKFICRDITMMFKKHSLKVVSMSTPVLHTTKVVSMSTPHHQGGLYEYSSSTPHHQGGLYEYSTSPRWSLWVLRTTKVVSMGTTHH